MTSLNRLAANIGADESRQIEAMIGTARQGWLDLGSAGATVNESAARVREALQQKVYAGVVLIGGLDVVPANRLSVLDADLRARVEQSVLRSGGRGDSDDFVVWNDDCYGDLDGDYLPELPVSRIPDARNGALVFTQLRSANASVRLKTGVRNADRPFAHSVFEAASVPTGRFWISEPTTSGDLEAQSLSGSLYFMLHGRDTDSRRYWGEDEFGDSVEAVNLSNVPGSLTGCVVFLGCCWGALTALPRASKYQPGDVLQPKTKEDSLAVAFLASGATAVVGCTGTHYSPNAQPFTYFGQPMHVSFWNALRRGLPPSQSIFEAKREYASKLPHGQFDAVSQAVELKICREFTCLGLGW